MNKKLLLTLPCIAAVAIATFVGKKTFESSALEGDALLAQDVEALSQGDSGSFFIPCYKASTTCSYNATDAGGNQCTVTVTQAVKAAPYK